MKQPIIIGALIGVAYTLSPLTVIGCAGLHAAERWLRPRLPALHAELARSAWGPFVEGAGLGALNVICAPW